MQNRLKEFDDNIIFENLDFSPSETPTSQMNGFLTGKTTLAPMEISARNTGRSVLTNSDTKLNANALQIVDLPQKDNRLKASNRVVQPLNRTIERVHSVHSDQRKPNPENEFDRKRKNNSLISKAQGLSMLKENENTISMNEGKPATDREKSIVNIRSDSPDLPIINETKNNNELIPIKENKKTERREHRTPPKVTQVKVNNNLKVEQLIKGKKTFNHRANMNEYLKRRGLKENSKVFCFNSRDEHIKRALKKFGWIENPHPNSFLFDLKWTYTDVETDYPNLMDGQYYNHFANNKELTMKSGLIENVRSCMEHGSDFWTFFPRAYDLGHINQMKEFQEDFERTTVTNLIKKHWEYIKMRIDKDTILGIKEKFRKKEEKIAAERLIDIFEKKKTLKIRDYKAVDQRKDFVMNLGIIDTAINCARTLVHQHINVAEADNFFVLSQLTDRIKKALMSCSELTPPYEDLPLSIKVIVVFYC